MNLTNYRSIKAHYNTDSSENSSLASNISDINFDFNCDNTNMNDNTETLETGATENLVHFGTNQQSRRTSMSSNGSYFPVRNSLSLLPVFNGKNIPVTQFTADCRGVNNLVDPDDRLFFFRAVLQTKLTGDAVIIRSIYTIDNLDDLCKALEKEFGNYKNFNHWQVQIDKLRQNRDESIENYISRVKQLKSDMTIVISNYPDPTARAGLKVFATSKLIDHFLGGLRNKSAQLLLAQDFDTLEKAIESVTRYVTKSHYHAERFKHNRFNDSQIICNYCKKIGHTENECRKKFFNSQNQNNPYNNPNFRQNNQYRDFGRDQNFSRNYDSSNSNYSNGNRFNNSNFPNNPNHQNNQPHQSNYHQNKNSNSNLNSQGQTKSVQRSGQTSSRANPIFLLNQESIQSEQPHETSSASPSTKSKTQEIDSC